MNKFYGGGGNNEPHFAYRFYVSDVTNDMFTWCEDYPLTGDFERFHVLWKYEGRDTDRPLHIVQFESKKAAYMFRIAFSESIVKENHVWPF